MFIVSNTDIHITQAFKTIHFMIFQIKNKNYFEPSSEISLPLPSNISEAALLILKSVYGIYLAY